MIKIISKGAIVVLIILTILSFGNSQSDVTEDFEWLIIFDYSPSDKNSENSLDDNYSQSPLYGDFHDGLARVSAYGKAGYINTEGKLVIKFQSGIYDDFHEGLSPILKGDFYGYINREGKIIVEPEFLHGGDYSFGIFSEGLAPVSRDGFAGYINRKGEKVIRFIGAPTLWEFSEGLARVKCFDKCGYINKQGKFVIKAQYSEANSFHEGLARVAIDEDVFYINKSGKIIFELPLGYKSCFDCFTSDNEGNFSNGLLCVSKEGKYGYLNKKGEVVIGLQFDDARDFHEGLARVVLNNVINYIDVSGKTVFTLPSELYNFDDYGFPSEPGNFSDGLLLVIINGQYGYLNKRGEVVISPQFDEARDFHEGFALVKKGDKRGFIKNSLTTGKR